MSELSQAQMEALPEQAPGGRRFTGLRKVRLGDVNQNGRLRFDALTRYTQDVSDDDTVDAELAPSPGWVVRSTVVDQVRPAELGESLGFTTFCSGLGRRWAERRLSVVGDRGAHYEVATVWVCVDPETGAPRALTDQFLELYSVAAAGRRVSARLLNPKLVDRQTSDLCWDSWQLRNADYDVYGHVNNAAYWALVEQWLPASMLSQPVRARIEYGSGLAPAETVDTVRSVCPQAMNLWWLEPEERGARKLNCERPIAASVWARELPGSLYRDSPSRQKPTDGSNATR